MKKHLKLFSLLLILSATLFCNTSTVLASAQYPNSEDLVFVSDGYTEEGVYYTIYEDTSDTNNTGIMPLIVVSKEKTVWVTYSDYVYTFPTVIEYSYSDPDYNIIMSGTLHVKSWFCENGMTYVSYSGIVIGHL